MAKKAEKKKKESLLPFFLGFGAVLTGYLMPAVGGITQVGWRSLSILIFAIVFWSTEALPVAATAMGILIMLPVLGISSYEVTFSKMGTVMIWRLVSLFIITEAIRRSGLADRIAYAALSLTKGRVRLTLFCVLMLNFLFAFLVPNGYSRTVLFVTIMVSWLQAVNIRGNIAKMFMIAIPVVSSVTSSAIIVGASVDIFAVDLFNTMVGYKWTYFNWLITNLPFCFIMTLVVYVLALIVFKPETDVVTGGEDVIMNRLKEMGGITKDEKTMIVLFVCLMVLWFTDTSEKIPAEMLVAFLIVFPSRFRLLSMKEAMKTVNWNIVFLFGASLSMAAGLQSSGAVNWLAANVFSHLNGLSVFFVALLVITFTAVVRLGMTNMTGAGATLLPILITVAQGININPVWLGMLCVMATCICFFFPAQSTNNLFPYGFGYYETKDLLRFGLTLFPIYAVILTLYAVFYWPLVTIPIH